MFACVQRLGWPDEPAVLHCPCLLAWEFNNHLLFLTCIFCFDLTHSGCFPTYAAHFLYLWHACEKTCSPAASGGFWSLSEEPAVVWRLFKHQLALFSSSCSVPLYTYGLAAALRLMTCSAVTFTRLFCVLLIACLRPLSVSADIELDNQFTNVF